MNKLITAAKATFVVAALIAAGAANAGLMGDTVGITYLDGATDFGTQSVVVGAGDEGNFFGNQFFNFGDLDFSIRSIGGYCGLTCNGQTVQLVLSSLDFGSALTAVDFSTNLTGVSVSFTNSEVTFSWTDQPIQVGTYLSANFTAGNAVPEPASIALVGLALTGLGFTRRKAAVAA